MPRAVFCPARFIMLCAVCCAPRGLLCFVRSVVPCAVFCFVRFIVPCTVYCALRGLLCLVRLIVPCTVYCALRGLLCLARFTVPCAVYCAAMFIYVGVRRTTFMIDKTFCVRQGFSCAERSHRADFARAGARACPCNADTWILSSVRQPWVRQRTHLA